MAKRTYGQTCSIARALDVLGERWTLLIIRELLLGPRRYKDLLGKLEGIGTNLLSDRLKALESDGLIEKTQLPPPASVQAYRLTDTGRALEPVLLELIRWSLTHLTTIDPQAAVDPSLNAVVMRALFDPGKALGVDESYQFVVDGEPLWARVHDGSVETGLGEIANPAAHVTGDYWAFVELGPWATLDELIETGRITLTGSKAAFKRCMKMFPVPQGPNR